MKLAASINKSDLKLSDRIQVYPFNLNLMTVASALGLKLTNHPGQPG